MSFKSLRSLDTAALLGNAFSFPEVDVPPRSVFLLWFWPQCQRTELNIYLSSPYLWWMSWESSGVPYACSNPLGHISRNMLGFATIHKSWGHCCCIQPQFQCSVYFFTPPDVAHPSEPRCCLSYSFFNCVHGTAVCSLPFIGVSLIIYYILFFIKLQ